MKFNYKKLLLVGVMVLLLVSVFSVSAFAANTGDVAGAVEDTWKEARGQIKDVVNNVIFPVIDLVLAVLFFVMMQSDGKADTEGQLLQARQSQIHGWLRKIRCHS